MPDRNNYAGLIPQSQGIPENGQGQQDHHFRIILIVAFSIIMLAGLTILLIWLNDPDQKPNTIIEYKIIELDKTSAVIVWITSKPSNSKVKYCPPSKMCLFTELDPKLVTLHVVPIKNFIPDTKYEMAIISLDKMGKETLVEFEFYKTGN
jgi:hypothetical protein